MDVNPSQKKLNYTSAAYKLGTYSGGIQLGAYSLEVYGGQLNLDCAELSFVL